ncbi:MAG TPA: ABC transporter substrate-binding protein [Mesotoga sp.]|nr:ABC transporter substrate-binding protein [Mesotoga sp.]MDI9374158.1 ABC transporter substrate-binding protein [Thermotogota bacterium]NLX34507.1 ABC transporter substrate-binding protein [Thermotogaceae bacterium]MDD4040706.1 ABC transporter substrate-binding protein [Mesotoga sp.]MDD4477727.1 ABC transporter substrate-binding protein [Mesotoga sp.]
MRKVLVLLAMASILLGATLGFAVYNIAFIVKATDSDFWQYTIVGGKNAEHDLQGLAKVTVYGPPSEADIDLQVSILENVVNTKPDAIVISSTSSEAPSLILDAAYKQGIKIVLIDNFVYDTGYNSFLATNNAVGGAHAADKLVEALKANGTALKGKVGLISAMAGVQVLTDRDAGFTNRLKEIAPDLQVLPTIYTNNDISRSANAAEDLLIAHSDLVGFFADNNHTGIGVARVIEQRGLENKIMAVAYDSDPLEIEALDSGALKALIVQDPHGMGYKGVMFAFMAINGEPLPAYLDTGVYVITKDILEDSMMILDPFSRKKY